jgi:hypothetical protein
MNSEYKKANIKYIINGLKDISKISKEKNLINVHNIAEKSIKELEKMLQ